MMEEGWKEDGGRIEWRWKEKQRAWTEGGRGLDGGGSEDEWRMHEGGTGCKEVIDG
jgi:hypothetical protein